MFEETNVLDWHIGAEVVGLAALGGRHLRHPPSRSPLSPAHRLHRRVRGALRPRRLVCGDHSHRLPVSGRIDAASINVDIKQGSLLAAGEQWIPALHPP